MQKLIEVQKKLLSFNKDGNNTHFKSKYLTLDGLLEKLLPFCNDLGIVIYHIMQDNTVITTVQSEKETITSSFPITDFTNPQKIGSAITYAKRYNISMIFNIVTDDDDDGNKASDKKVEKQVFGIEQFEKFKRDRNKHKGNLTSYDKAMTLILSNYTIKTDVSNLLRDYYDDQDIKSIS